MVMRAKLAPLALQLAIYHDVESDHFALQINRPNNPVLTHEDRVAVCKLLRRALDKLEDRVAWRHVTEVVADAMGDAA